MESTNRSITLLSFYTCFFLDLPDPQLRLECSVRNNASVCIACPYVGKYLAGGVGGTGRSDWGNVITIVLWSLTVFLAACGIITNSLVITVIKRGGNGKAFDILLRCLAGVDLLGSVAALIGSTSVLVILENWNRSYVIQYLAYFGISVPLVARSGSSFLAVLITTERFLVISYPLKASSWFTETTTKIFAVVTFTWSLFLGYPRFVTSRFLRKSDVIQEDIPSLRDMPYVAVATRQGEFWYTTMGGYFDKIDFWIPLPLLLILNILLHLKIREVVRKRKESNFGSQKEIQTVKIFVPIVVMLFLCNIEPYVHYYFFVVRKISYRELVMGMYLSVSFNSFVNFFFHLRSREFRRKFREFYCYKICNKLVCGACEQFQETQDTTVSGTRSVHRSVQTSSVKPK